MGLTYSRTLSFAAASANNICQSQTPAGAGALTLNGSTVSGGVATLDTQRYVLFTFAANETGHNFVITGTNSDGTTQSETVLGTTAGTVLTQLNYLTVTSITISAAATGAITVGTSAATAAGATPWFSVDTMRQPVNVGIEVVTTGTVNYTVQYTMESFWSPPVVINTAFNHATLVTLMSSNSGSILFPVTGIRLQMNSYTNPATATITYVQAGP